MLTLKTDVVGRGHFNIPVMGIVSIKDHKKRGQVLIVLKPTKHAMSMRNGHKVVVYGEAKRLSKKWKSLVMQHTGGV